MKYDYGQEVIYNCSDDKGMATTMRCAIVGITPVETIEQAKAFGYPRGTILYTIEFGDGTDKLVSENELAAS